MGNCIFCISLGEISGYLSPLLEVYSDQAMEPLGIPEKGPGCLCSAWKKASGWEETPSAEHPYPCQNAQNSVIGMDISQVTIVIDFIYYLLVIEIRTQDLSLSHRAALGAASVRKLSRHTDLLPTFCCQCWGQAGAVPAGAGCCMPRARIRDSWKAVPSTPAIPRRVGW